MFNTIQLNPNLTYNDKKGQRNQVQNKISFGSNKLLPETIDMAEKLFLIGNKEIKTSFGRRIVLFCHGKQEALINQYLSDKSGRFTSFRIILHPDKYQNIEATKIITPTAYKDGLPRGSSTEKQIHSRTPKQILAINKRVQNIIKNFLPKE